MSRVIEYQTRLSYFVTSFLTAPLFQRALSDSIESTARNTRSGNAILPRFRVSPWIEGIRNVVVEASQFLFFFSSFQEPALARLVKQTEATPLSSPFTGSDIYDTMFSDSTRGDISPSELGSGEGSGDDDFVFDTTFFIDSSKVTTVEKSDTPISEATTDSKAGTTEFGTEVTESSDITEETDVTIEGSGTTIEEEESGATASTDVEETTLEGTQAATTKAGSTFLLNILIKFFKKKSLL